MTLCSTRLMEGWSTKAGPAAAGTIPHRSIFVDVDPGTQNPIVNVVLRRGITVQAKSWIRTASPQKHLDDQPGDHADAAQRRGESGREATIRLARWAVP